MKRVSRAFLMVGAMVFLAACASEQTLTVQTSTPFKSVWQNCIDTLPDVSYAATSTDMNSGLIVAERSIGFHGRVAKLNISVRDKSPSTEVVVSFIPANGEVSGQDTAQDYVDALKKRLPDIQATVAQ